MALTPLPVNNSIPEEEKVDWAVLFLRNDRAGGLYGMIVEHLQSCLQSETREDLSDPSQRGEVVGMIQSTLRKMHLGEECIWKTIVLISKGNGKF